MSLKLRFAVLLLCITAVQFVQTSPHRIPSFGDAPVFAADKKTKKKKRKRRARKKAEEEKASYIDPNEPTNVVGADSGFSHEDFEAQAEEVGVGLDAVLLLDASRSMQRTDPERLRDQGAKLFLRFLSEEDRVSVIQFAENTNVLTPLTPATPEVQQQLDDSIEAVSTEGNFTDLWSPIVAAMELLRQEGRPTSKKVVILLSDGKMDPNPRSGSAAELTKRLRQSDLPGYKDQKIELYTLALSDQADRNLLEEMAKATGGISWYAPTVNKIHQIFSDLFLTIKRPQVVELEGAGFEVDSTTTEATFYVSREKPEQVVSIIDPTGNEFNNTNFPPGVKWYRGDLFDVVTIRSPLPGRWAVKGLDTPSGFATLLTELKLEVNWPTTNVKVGDSVVLMARLAESGAAVSTPGLKEVTFYTYKIVNTRTGELYYQGSLSDAGEKGDAKAGDEIFSDMVKLDKVGEYKALVAVAGPTFSRQQHISFSVSTGAITLQVEPPNEFTGEQGAIHVEIDKKLSGLKKAKVQLVAKPVDAKKAIAIPLGKFKLPDGRYGVPTQMLEKGSYELHARIKGTDPKSKKTVEAQSDIIIFESKGATEKLIIDENEEDIVIEEVELDSEGEEEEEGGSEDLFWGLGSLALALGWAGALGFFYYRAKGKQEPGVVVEQRDSYVVPEDIRGRIDALQAIASDTKRELSTQEFELFGAAATLIGVSAAAEDASGAEGESEEAEEQAQGESEESEESQDSAEASESEEPQAEEEAAPESEAEEAQAAEESEPEEAAQDAEGEGADAEESEAEAEEGDTSDDEEEKE